MRDIVDRILYGQNDAPNGRIFEKMGFDALYAGLMDVKRAGKNKNLAFKPESLKNTTGGSIDTDQGTDIIWDKGHEKIRLDLTISFNKKDNMPFIFESDIEVAPGHKLKFGIRHGNRHNGYTEFKSKQGDTQPVVVIGIDMDDYEFNREKYYRNGRDAENIFDDIRTHAVEILGWADEVYQEFTDPEYLEYAEDTLFVKNDAFKDRFIDSKKMTPALTEMLRRTKNNVTQKQNSQMLPATAKIYAMADERTKNNLSEKEDNYDQTCDHLN